MFLVDGIVVQLSENSHISSYIKIVTHIQIPNNYGFIPLFHTSCALKVVKYNHRCVSIDIPSC